MSDSKAVWVIALKDGDIMTDFVVMDDYKKSLELEQWLNVNFGRQNVTVIRTSINDMPKFFGFSKMIENPFWKDVDDAHNGATEAQS